MRTEADKEIRYQPFITGELVDLRIPNQLAIDEDGWAEWFNNTADLQATGHGIYPNHRDAQRKILDGLASDRTKIVLLICDQVSGKAIGVVSLQNINVQNRSAEIAINASSLNKQRVHRFATLEAMALITQHGFDELGLLRIYGGQAFPMLRTWNKMMELIGYRTESILRNSFIRGHHISDTAGISCLYENYTALKSHRGSLWGSATEIQKTMRKQSKESHADLLSSQMAALEEEYFKFLFAD